MIQVLGQETFDHKKIRCAPSKVSLKPLVYPGVENLNNMPVDMSLSGRYGKNLISAALYAADFSAGGEKCLVVYIFIGVCMK